MKFRVTVGSITSDYTEYDTVVKDIAKAEAIGFITTGDKNKILKLMQDIVDNQVDVQFELEPTDEYSAVKGRIELIRED